jgi:hypothetical protein
MTRVPNRVPRFVATSVALACIAVAGCSGDSTVAPVTPTPGGEMRFMGTVMVEVDLKKGTVTTHPMESGSFDAPPGVSAQIYGAASQVRHIFQLQGGAPIGNDYFLNDHIENLLNYAIGTNQRGTTAPTPEDTMGAYVFVSSGPTVIAGCTQSLTCKVDLTGYDGTFAFTSPGQRYMYFKTILEANDGVTAQGKDFTDQSPANGGTGIDYFRTLKFTTTGAVTNFKFGVAVSAAWIKPNETNWVVRYFGDSLPNRVGTGFAAGADLRSEPDWRVRQSGSPTATIVSSGCRLAGNCLRIVSGSSDSLIYYRSDSLDKAENAFIEADIVTSGLANNSPSVFLGMEDRGRFLSFGISANKAGFTNRAGSIISSTVNPTSSVNVRITKTGTGNVVANVNGSTITLARSSFDSLTVATDPSPHQYFWFGNRKGGGTSNWSSVVYQVGP